MSGIFDVWHGVAERAINPGTVLTLTGAGFLLVALTIFAFPELLAYLVATVLFWLGGVALALAFWVRKAGQESAYRSYEIT